METHLFLQRLYSIPSANPAQMPWRQKANDIQSLRSFLQRPLSVFHCVSRYLSQTLKTIWIFFLKAEVDSGTRRALLNLQSDLA